MTAVSFSGLATGLDTGKLIDQLVAAERTRAEALEKQQKNLGTQAGIVGGLSTALAALGSAVKGMDLAAELQPRTAKSSDGRVSIAASAGAPASAHTVRVLDTALAKVVSSRTFVTADAGVLGSGSLEITPYGGSLHTINWTFSDSLADIANRINDAAAGVRASVIYDGTSYQLVASAIATGSTGVATFADLGDGLGLEDPANVKVAARDARMVIDGITVTRSQNAFSDVLPGLTITALSQHAVGEVDATVTVDLDRDGLREKLKTFVAKYNAVQTSLHAQLDYVGVRKGSDTLFGDTTLRQLQAALSAAAGAEYATKTLRDLGISRDKTGMMTLDEAKLDSALTANPAAVEAVFASGGFAQKMTTLVDSYTSTTGILASKSQSLTNRGRALQTTIDRINDNADKLRKRLEDQFTKLEQAMSRLQSQGSYLARMLTGG